MERLEINEALDLTLIYLNYTVLSLEDNGKVDEAKGLYTAYKSIKETAERLEQKRG